MKMTLICHLILLLGYSASAQETTRTRPSNISPIAKNSEGQYMRVVEQQNCNEIRIQTPDNDQSKNWGVVHSGGYNDPSDSRFKTLQQGKMENVIFGKNNLISFNYVGKRLVPDSLTRNEGFSLESQRLIDLSRPERPIIGRYMGLHGFAKDKIPDSNTRYGRDRVKVGTIYINPNYETTPPTVDCEYVAGDLNLETIQAERRCVWFDKDSLPSNGKPYCW